MAVRGGNLVKSELVRILGAKLAELPAKDVELAVNCMIEQLTEALVRDDRVEIRGFGSFSLHHHPPRTGRNPKTGAPVTLPKTVRVHFKPGKAMKDRVNAARGQYKISD